MSENLRDEMQLALKQTWRDRAMSVSFDVTWRAMTDAAWSVVGPELDRLRAEVERLTDLKDNYLDEYERVFGEALDSEAECAVLRARLAAVEARCREALDENRPPHATNSEVVWLVEDLFNILASVPAVDAGDREPASDPYLCRHGKYRHEHSCDDHLDRDAMKVQP